VTVIDSLGCPFLPALSCRRRHSLGRHLGPHFGVADSGASGGRATVRTSGRYGAVLLRFGTSSVAAASCSPLWEASAPAISALSREVPSGPPARPARWSSYLHAPRPAGPYRPVWEYAGTDGGLVPVSATIAYRYTGVVSSTPVPEGAVDSSGLSRGDDRCRLGARPGSQAWPERAVAGRAAGDSRRPRATRFNRDGVRAVTRKDGLRICQVVANSSNAE
jgi:hypothetical protein